MTMDVRYGGSPQQFSRMTAEEIRREFLIEDLFLPGRVRMVYSHADRMVTLGVMPVDQPLPLDRALDARACFGTDFFLQRRELGLFNVGGAGSVSVGGKTYELGYRDCLYVAMGARDLTFISRDPASPAKFYLASAPAHRACETRLLTLEMAAKNPTGSPERSNQRVINQFIHPSVLKTCQLSMGMTALAPGSVWNTMPAHTHERRMEVYFYFELPKDQRVFHLMGRPGETRHLVLKDEQAVISPSWSIHAGCGTANYAFIWAMAGENQAFDDMDPVLMDDMR